MRFLLGESVYEPAARRLSRAGKAVHLSAKATLLLERLLDRRPAIASPQELRDALWPDTFVGYSSLGQVVAELRRALGREGRRLIRTAYGAGYAFDGEVVVEPEADQGGTSGFCLRWGTAEIPLRAGVNLVGRGPECSCRIASSRVSRQHARIVVRGRTVTLDDLGSKNGTRVRGRPVDGPTTLADGDVILLGQEAVLLGAVRRPTTTETDGTSSGADPR